MPSYNIGTHSSDAFFFYTKGRQLRSIAGIRLRLRRTVCDAHLLTLLQRLMANLKAESWGALKRSRTWTVQTGSGQDGRGGSGRLQERSSTSGKKSHDSGSSGGGQLSVELLQNRGCRSGQLGSRLLRAFSTLFFFSPCRKSALSPPGVERVQLPYITHIRFYL